VSSYAWHNNIVFGVGGTEEDIQQFVVDRHHDTILILQYSTVRFIRQFVTNLLIGTAWIFALNYQVFAQSFKAN